jgi:hypothetical protein
MDFLPFWGCFAVGMGFPSRLFRQRWSVIDVPRSQGLGEAEPTSAQNNGSSFLVFPSPDSHLQQLRFSMGVGCVGLLIILSYAYVRPVQ